MKPMTVTTPAPSMSRRPRSLAEDLERRRLSHRAARVRRTLDAMRRLAEGRDVVPAPLRHGIDDFQHELTRVEERLHQLERARAR